MLEPAALRKPRHVQPVPRPPLPVRLRRQQPVNHRLPRLRRRRSRIRRNLLRRRRQPCQHQKRPPQHHLRTRRRRQPQSLLRRLLHHKRIHRMPRPRHLHLRQWPERPPLPVLRTHRTLVPRWFLPLHQRPIIRRPIRNPRLQRPHRLRTQRRPRPRHVRLLLPLHQPQQPAPRHIERHHRHPLRPAPQQILPRRQIKIPLRLLPPVTLHTMFIQHPLHSLLKPLHPALHPLRMIRRHRHLRRTRRGSQHRNHRRQGSHKLKCRIKTDHRPLSQGPHPESGTLAPIAGI